MAEQTQRDYIERVKKADCAKNYAFHLAQEINLLVAGAKHIGVPDKRDRIKLGLLFGIRQCKLVVDSDYDAHFFYDDKYYCAAPHLNPLYRSLRFSYADFGFAIPDENQEDFGIAMMELIREHCPLDFERMDFKGHGYLVDISHYYRHVPIIEHLD